VSCSSHEECTVKGLTAFCQADGRCKYSTAECDLNDHFTCDGLDNYCEEGFCDTKDCNSGNCLKISSPEFTYTETAFSLKNQAGFSLDVNSHINDPTEDQDLALTVVVDLGFAKLFLQEEGGIISQREMT
jgi:hypothetical protein